ncbi:MAG: DUF1799 domain-containing protein [Ghiorsea sp.]|nr:DUF1799 domain-containing protein [Ghiorsea sp.]
MVCLACRGAKKKLIDAATFWARGGKGQFDDDDAKMLGEVAEDEPFPVWQENEDIVHVFTSCATQWRLHEGVRYGLIYTEVKAVMDMLNIDNKQHCFEGVRIMEQAALEVWA